MLPACFTVAIHPVGLGQGTRQACGHSAEFHGVGARLDHCQDTAFRLLMTQALQRGLDRSGMMREIIVDGNAAYLASHFHTPLHSTEIIQSGNRVSRRNADMLSGGDGSQCISLIVRARMSPVYGSHQLV